MMKTYYRKAKGAILVYDVSLPDTFEGLDLWRKHLASWADPGCVMVVAANKVDLPEHKVSKETVGRCYLVA